MAHHFSSESPKVSSKLPHIIIGTIIALLLAMYGAGVAFFSFYGMPRTTIQGISADFTPLDTVYAQAAHNISTQTITLTYEGTETTLDAHDLGLALDHNGFKAQVAQTCPAWSWPLAVFQPHTIEVQEALTIDKAHTKTALAEKFSQTLEHLASQHDILVFDAKTNRFTVNRDAFLGALESDLIAEDILTALKSKTPTLALKLSRHFSQDASVAEVLSQANAILEQGMTLTLKGTEVARVEPQTLASWIHINPDLSMSFKEDLINTWSAETLKPLNSKGSDRTYTRFDGKTVTVSDGNRAYGRSVYGWVLDYEATAKHLIEAFQNKQATAEVVASQEAARVNAGGADWPERYIDVDLSAQKAYFVDGAQVLWSADIVTGQPNLNRSTPTGVWQITSRKSGDINLKGPTKEDGQPEWDSHVNFWMGVVGNIVGFHNAPWRSSFGGKIYQSNGSHGCINLSYQNGQKLYELVKIGDVVVVHN